SQSFRAAVIGRTHTLSSAAPKVAGSTPPRAPRIEALWSPGVAAAGNQRHDGCPSKAPAFCERLGLSADEALRPPRNVATSRWHMLPTPGRYSRRVERRRSPVRIRRCPATAMPRQRGRARSTAPCRTNAGPRRKGGSCGHAAGPLPPQTRRFFISGQTIESHRRPSRRPQEAAASAELALPLSFALSWSGGKDSALALWRLRHQRLQPDALITTVTEGYDRISMHGVRRELLTRQANALGIPLVEVVIPPTCPNGVYETRMAQ